jgi:ribose 5-phosphate isomerase B
MARRHNDANVVSLAGVRLSPAEADAIVSAFLRTEFEGGRHARRVGQIADVERDGQGPRPPATESTGAPATLGRS